MWRAFVLITWNLASNVILYCNQNYLYIFIAMDMTCARRWDTLVVRQPGTLVLVIILLVVAFVYKRTILEIRKKRWRLYRKKMRSDSPPDDIVGKVSSLKLANSLLRYFELDPDVSGSFPEIKFESMAEYMGSLSLESGALSIESILVSILDRFGLTLALPLALLIPSTWKKSYDRKDVETKFLPFPRRLIGAALSTKSLGATCEIVKEIGYDMFARGKEAAHAEKQRYGAVQLLLLGSNPKSDNGLSKEIREVFQMDAAGLEDVSRKILLCKEAEALQPPKEVHPALVGLHFGNYGLKSLYSPKEESINAVVSCICNRLVGNVLQNTHLMNGAHDSCDEIFRVVLENGENIDTLEGFFQALEIMGHSVSLSLRTNITSMGLGLCVAYGTAKDSVYAQIPICYPLKTGLTMRKKDSSLDHREAITLMTHGACFVKISGPLLKNVELEWCLNITGMTGFQPVGGIARPWQQDPRAFVSHNEDIFLESHNRYRAFRFMSAISAVTNSCADVDSIVVGGYGFMGVCLDSVALLQHALTGTCTMYPLFLGGAGKTSLLDGYMEFEKQQPDYGEECAILRESLRQLPCDILVEPGHAVDAANRALASLPRSSIFASAESCKKDLVRARDFARRVQSE